MSSNKENSSAWGQKDTQYFFELTPDRILDAVESVGIRCTGRSLALNSMENRVYEVEVEVEDRSRLKSPSEAFRIVKFYRPGRWSAAQIQEEHQFLVDLQENEIPVVAPLPFADGSTLKKIPDANIWYTVFPKIGGRSPEELDREQLERVGRLLARLHNVGAVRTATHRVAINPDTYGRSNLQYLLEHRMIPAEIEGAYADVVKQICDFSEPWFVEAESQRIHGDCHFGNLLWGPSGPFWVDFDDMVRGPCVQDVWLIMPGRDEYAREQLGIMLDAYDQMRPFDRRTLRLIEPLRALRFVHFSAWIARRWADPAFPRVFSHFGTQRYWQEQLQDLQEQLRLIQGVGSWGDF